MRILTSGVSRLNSSQLNNLTLSCMVGTSTEEHAACTLEDGRNESEELNYKKISKDGISFCVFQAVSDIKNKQQRQGLVYINDVIQGFARENPNQEARLLIPLMQSRLWKKHCVLVDITITEDKKEINIHDSQSWWRNLFYPNCFKDLKQQGYQVNYTSYGKQKDNFSCVYFVYHYIKEILEKSSDGLERIFVSLNTLKGEDPIGKLIQDNFKRKYPEARSVESGESIPWQEELLEECLKGNYSHY